MFIPGTIISILTFPGVIIHEWSHKLFCQWLGVRVLQVKYFRIGNPAGYVLHENPVSYKQTFWIAVGPLLVNSILTIIISYFSTQTINGSVLQFILLWIAISAGMHAFPSDIDMKFIENASKDKLKQGGSILYYLAFPFVALIGIANVLRIIWFDLWYAFGLMALGGVRPS